MDGESLFLFAAWASWHFFCQAPELLREDSPVGSAKADVYAIGMVSEPERTICLALNKFVARQCWLASSL
jgi:hypothetical protein